MLVLAAFTSKILLLVATYNKLLLVSHILFTQSLLQYKEKPIMYRYVFNIYSLLLYTLQVPKHIRERAERAALYMIAKDVQPFSCVQDDGFRHFAQTMIDIGSKYGSVPFEDIMCDQTMPSKTLLPKFYNECVQKLKDELAGVTHVAITTDHWTDDSLKYSYQAFTVHNINNSYCLKSGCVALCEFSESKTGIAVVTASYIYVLDARVSIGLPGKLGVINSGCRRRWLPARVGPQSD